MEGTVTPIIALSPMCSTFILIGFSD
jgi:hypothetical protein